jgi:hypothetical protein
MGYAKEILEEQLREVEAERDEHYEEFKLVFSKDMMLKDRITELKCAIDILTIEK